MLGCRGGARDGGNFGLAGFAECIVSGVPDRRLMSATALKHTNSAPTPAISTTGPPSTAATTSCCAAIATTIGIYSAPQKPIPRETPST